MAIRLRALVKHPSRVEGDTGIAVEKANGVTTVSLDLASLSETASIADDSLTNILLITPGLTDDDADLYEQMEVEDFLALAVAYDAELAAIAGLTSAANKLPYFTGSGTAALTDFTAAARTLLDDASVGAMATTLGLGTGDSPQFTGVNVGHATDTTITRTSAGVIAVEGSNVLMASNIGVSVQAYDAELAALAGLTSAADKFPYFTGSGTAALGDITTFGRSLVDDADASAARTTLGLAIGTDVQAYNARLADLAGITYNQGDVLYYNGTNLVDLAPGTSGQFLKTQGAGANPVWDNIPGGGDMLAANNLSDVSNTTTARNNISAVLSGHIYGLTTSNNGSDATNDIDIAVGEAADSTAVQLMRLTGALTKRLDANWSAGTGNGMRNSAAAITDTTYHIYLVSKAAGADVDIYAHTSTTVSTVITALQAESGGGSYVYARRIASIIRSSGAILAFRQRGDLFKLGTPVRDYQQNNPGTSALTKTLTIPVGLKLRPIMHFDLYNGTTTGAVFGLLSDPDDGDATPSATIYHVYTISATALGESVQITDVFSNASAQVRVRLSASAASDQINGVTFGWIDDRGRSAP